MVSMNTTWTSPHQGFSKCNLDGAIFAEANTFGAGFCLRDPHKNFIKAKTLFAPGIPSPEDAEHGHSPKP
ncbi:hypothetical protein GmHk_13G039239 [Glycine max]|nr:hypothetical protein GYH30_038076 [Glycine max]KAH1218993.1 hypothetical protein GmHk_13G039239 [Glycine max]